MVVVKLRCLATSGGNKVPKTPKDLKESVVCRQRCSCVRIVTPNIEP